MTATGLYERALEGARFLDVNMRGWRRRIRLRDLDMKSPRYMEKGDCGCVLAQLDAEGDYYRTLDRLGVEDIEGDLGFVDDDWDGLTDAWKRILRENVR